MDKIQVQLLNAGAVKSAEKMAVFTARLTQRGERMQDLSDVLALLERPYTEKTAKGLFSLPHPTIQKFGAIHFAVIGASRRFLAQITRHQSETKFMSASLVYSDFSDTASFVTPYEMLKQSEQVQSAYCEQCMNALEAYKAAIASGVDRDTAGYLMPQAMRNTLIISATPYQWKHMIAQHICRRNTSETRYVLLRVWSTLRGMSPAMFAPETTGAYCVKGACEEGKMACGRPMKSGATPEEILSADFPLLWARA